MALFSDLFDGIMPATRAALDECRRRRQFQPGENLQHAGDPPVGLYRIESGRAKLWRPGRDGSALTLAYLSAGDTPGLVSLVRGRASPASTTAVSAVAADIWPRQVLTPLLHSDVVLATNALSIVSDLVVLLADRLDDAVHGSAEQQISRALLRLTAEQADWHASGEVDIAISRQELADLTGMTLYTASRVLSDWGRRGLVESARGRVTIKQPAALAALADLDG